MGRDGNVRLGLRRMIEVPCLSAYGAHLHGVKLFISKTVSWIFVVFAL